MVHRRQFWSFVAMLVSVVAVASPASATTLQRAGLDELVRGNAIVVSGRALDARSYWNAEGTFILTDITFVADTRLKGDPGQREFRFTILGGTVGNLTTIIVGGPEVVPGKSYVLFLNREDLPGVDRALTIRELSQGIFDIVDGPGGMRAVSQARNERLVADKFGKTDPVGGTAEIVLDQFSRDIRRVASGR